MMASPMKKLFTKKTLIITGISAIISILIFIAFFPFIFPMIAIYQRPAGVEQPFLIEFDLFNPTYGVLTEPTGAGRITPAPEIGFTVATLKRKNLIFFEEDELILTGKFNEETTLYAKQLLREKEFTKASEIPDNLIISYSKEEIIDDLNEVEILDTREDRYYEDIEKLNSDEGLTLEDFSVLKVGMSLKEVKDLVGNSDRIESFGLWSESYERNYKLNSDRVNFVALVFDQDADENAKAALKNVIVVYDDRTTEELDLEN
jgi:hypothetical protein